MNVATIVVVDDDEDTRVLITSILRAHGHAVTGVETARECLERMRTHQIDLVITDQCMPHVSGTQLCEQVRDRYPDVATLLITGRGDVETAAAALRSGASDFVVKPPTATSLRDAVERVLDKQRAHTEVKRIDTIAPEHVGGLVGNSPALLQTFETVRRVAPGDASVLITGESGTGKEVIARAIHEISHRTGAFIAINCAAVPADLLESELFGHVQGAFTDAKGHRAGLFQQANEGTLFLDELGEMPIEMQAKLLRALQERKVRPVGADSEIAVTCRIVAATNKDLAAETKAGHFREDLFYRVNVVAIPVAPLRDRPEDIPVIARHILARIAQRTHRPLLGVTPEAMRSMVDFIWPGNVRELENALERAAALVGTSTAIELGHLPARVRTYQPVRFAPAGSTPDDLITLDEMERRYVRRVIELSGGNKSEAARILDIDRRSLYRRLRPIPGDERITKDSSRSDAS